MRIATNCDSATDEKYAHHEDGLNGRSICPIMPKSDFWSRPSDMSQMQGILDELSRTVEK